MAISPILAAAVGGLQDAARRSNIAAHNIVNADTSDFRTVSATASRLTAQTSAASASGVEAQLAARNGVDTALEFTNLIRAETAFKSAASLVETADDLSRALIDVVG